MKTAFKIFTAALTLFLLGRLIIAARKPSWDEATMWAALLVGLVAAVVVIWQGYLIKQQIAFSTYLDLDKEWNSAEMIEARQRVHEPGSKNWDHSRLEVILEFFEKLASMYKLSGDMAFIYESTLGWYAARYFLFARKHGQIDYLRELWKDDLYRDLENLYTLYLRNEKGRSKKAQEEWEANCFTTEERFWKQERKD
jgi:hypothetical protein